MQLTRYEHKAGNKIVIFRENDNGSFLTMLCDNYNTPYYQTEKEYTGNRTRALKKYFDYCKEIEA